MKAKHTAGPWRYFKDLRNGESGNLHATQFWIDSESRKAMALLEVWEITKETWKNKSKAKEQRATLKEVEANARLIAAAPELFTALKNLLALTAKRLPATTQRANHGHKNPILEARAALTKAT